MKIKKIAEQSGDYDVRLYSDGKKSALFNGKYWICLFGFGEEYLLGLSQREFKNLQEELDRLRGRLLDSDKLFRVRLNGGRIVKILGSKPVRLSQYPSDCLLSPTLERMEAYSKKRKKQTDWTQVDWSLTDEEIATQEMRNLKTVAMHRKKEGGGA